MSHLCTPWAPRSALAVGIFSLFLALLLVAGCRRAAAPRVLNKAGQGAATMSQYAGSAACAPCHAAEFAMQSRSHHALTLRHADRASLGKLSPQVGNIGSTGYSIEETPDGFVFNSAGKGAGGAKIEYALGSGISNLTFIGQIGPDRLTEFRMSYAEDRKLWFITPGQETSGDLKLGTVHPTGMAARCVLCHADTLAPGSDKPADGSLGVGCEFCHGPGAAHVAAAKSKGPPDLKMASLAGLSAHKINMLCGRCHRTVDDVGLSGFDAPNTARFEAYAIEISPCYRESGEQLSCITCHDPHTDASKDITQYEKACLSCHSSAQSGTANKRCPVNPTTKCISCHMPQRQVLPGTKIPLRMTDHLIWAYKPTH